MEQRVREVMTAAPVAVDAKTTVSRVAHRMSEENIGSVLVTEGDRLCGLVTDRDLVVRVLAEDADPGETTAKSVCSKSVVSVGPQEPTGNAVDLMRTHALRRLAVVDGNECVGVVALGDLAVERDPESALGAISAASPNR
ncbi:CBS domain-containing protein [Streptomyces beihaiensis]|uniref:CBS domain-containing protein n=1 Tax=Streptomyces beihaiensis TaxID=2984495 RepID=A0ABT3TS72_9ACTN|nr:CBS domain-containing protein [Streptomyces beihaiensis]MCX3059262.1 CBS domain-containing protein [Streptomyces beihaiensis]